MEESCQGEAQRNEAEKKRRKEKGSRERQVRHEIVQNVVEDIEKRARPQVDVKPTAQRTVGQSDKQSWDCSRIENEGEEEEVWQKESQIEVQWAKDEKLEEMLEQ